MPSPRLFWFRNDLRLDDHPALSVALNGAKSLLPVFVFDPKKFNVPTLAGARKSSARRAQFLLQSVACLRGDLEAKGSGLAVFLGDPAEVLGKLGAEWDCFATRGICTEELAEEAAVFEKVKQLKTTWGNTLYLPTETGFKKIHGKMPLLFTDFRKSAEGKGKIREPLDPPKRMPPLPEFEEHALRFLPSLEELGYSVTEAKAAREEDPRGVMSFKGGEGPALRRLQDWIFDGDYLQEYFNIRNGMLGQGYSSKFSPWMAVGCLSPRRVWKAAKTYEAERVKNKSTYWLVFELIWRDFFAYVAYSYGKRIFIPGGVIGEVYAYRGTKEDLQKWKDGETGDPLVDANMLELKATGWMSNRGRQNVASYLIHNLHVDWRYGAAHFEELLLDYDPASNWGNWVAAAGLTGQRINRFNTKKQLNDYDPKKLYVNHWLKSQVPVGVPSKKSKISRPKKKRGRGGGALALLLFFTTTLGGMGGYAPLRQEPLSLPQAHPVLEAKAPVQRHAVAVPKRQMAYLPTAIRMAA